jgi:hypothetical protein
VIPSDFLGKSLRETFSDSAACGGGEPIVSKKPADMMKDAKADVEELRKHVTKIQGDLKKYVDDYEVTINSNKFSVEQQGDGLTIDVAFQASIQPKKKKRL